ncbi:MAG: hypothetical protein ACOYOH_25135 [Paracraurococcus sp.]
MHDYPTTDTDREDRTWALDYRAAVAMRYHSRRRSFLDGLARAEPVATLLLGSSAFAAATTGLTWLVMALTLLVALLSAVLLAYGVAERAKLHERLFKAWAGFRADLARLAPDDDAALRAMEARRLEIGAETPHQLLALTILCQNEENEFRRAGEQWQVGRVQAALANILTLPFQRFERLPAPPA